MRRFAILICMIVMTTSAAAHDTWVQTNTRRVVAGDVVHVDLMLGNHGNEHRDFKLAGKVTLVPCRLAVIDPLESSLDLKPHLIDLGYAPKDGFWSDRFVGRKPGLHSVSHTLDTLHGRTRAIKSGKAYFAVSAPREETSPRAAGFDKPLGHALEIIPRTDPTRALAHEPIRVQVQYQGRPLRDARISFIPRGQILADGFDQNFERKTDGEGTASFTPESGNFVLIVVHHLEADQSGDGYDKTHYGATLTLDVAEAK